MIDIKDLKHVHLVGIGGIGVSAIAEILLSYGIRVSGSDLKSSSITRHLESLGAEIHYSHNPDNLQEDTDLLVYTSAVKEDNPELLKGAELAIETVSRSQMLGLVMENYPDAVAISGAHGKTTTTSMVAVILAETDLDPTIFIGAEVEAIGGNARIGKGSLFVTEACEYQENFLDFTFNKAIILNIDEDHLDYYEDLDHIVRAFGKLTQKLPGDGELFINIDDFNAKKIYNTTTCKQIITFGIINDTDYLATNITYNESGLPKFDLMVSGKCLGKIELSIPGRHNIYNSLAAIALTHHYGVDLATITRALKKFKGAHRRFEYLGTCQGALIYDDYAHHPNEIKATLEAARKLEARKIIAIFQPHTYTRTKELLIDFSLAFDQADEVILTDIYAAREKDTLGIHTRDLEALLAKRGKKVTYFSSFDEIIDYLLPRLNPEHLLFTLGAGNIHEVAETIIKKSQ